MKLNDVPLENYGSFKEGASFELKTQKLPALWDYIYQNRKILVRLDQFGLSYSQAYPPKDIIMFRRDRFEKMSVWTTWVSTDAEGSEPFYNFDGTHTDDYSAIYSPEKAVYTVKKDGITVETEIFVPSDLPAVAQKVTLTNTTEKELKVKATPVLRPACAWFDMAPWDYPEWYLRTGLFKDPGVGAGFSIQLTSPVCNVAKRRSAVMWTEEGAITGAEVSFEKFVGYGDFKTPDAIAEGKLQMSMDDAMPWGEYSDQNNLFAYPPVCAFQYEYTLAPGESKSFRQSFGLLEPGEENWLPKLDVARKMAVLLDDDTCEKDIAAQAAKAKARSEIRTIDSPDEALNQYANEWLPLQMDWVCSLDRGHPSGMRGGRDGASDFTANVPIDPDWTREIILTQLSCQKPDGLCPRHYSSAGHSGKERDHRMHRDAGAWVIEMVYEYLAHTKDFSILEEKVPWLDEPADQTDTVWNHLLKALDFYLGEDGRGEHGLVKIEEGEWLDTVNIAGQEGRGEGVMLTNQVIMACHFMKEIAQKTGADKALIDSFVNAAGELKESLLKHALNEEGYFNGFFNDDGNWIFSTKDPDGQKRVYGPASWWSLASGVAIPDQVDSCLATLDFLKCDAGWRLNWPQFRFGEVKKVGRMATCDTPPGRAEHGNAYNQGSHGFLARGLAAAGKGDLLYEALINLLPYDQERHPVKQVMTPPYAVLNVWEEIPRFKNRGKNTFLTGSISYGIRGVYDWMYGIRPNLDGLVIDPVLPSSFKEAKATIHYRGKECSIIIGNGGDGCQVKSMTLNSEPVTKTITDVFSGRTLYEIDDELLQDHNEILVTV
jgi:cellobiose phosphorylase